MFSFKCMTFSLNIVKRKAFGAHLCLTDTQRSWIAVEHYNIGNKVTAIIAIHKNSTLISNITTTLGAFTL